MNIYQLFYKLLQNATDVITVYDSSDYNKSRQRVITIYDRYDLISNHDKNYYNSRQLLLQFTTVLYTILQTETDGKNGSHPTSMIK